MKLLAISNDTFEALQLLRQVDETDEALIERIVKFARCYMIIIGSEEARAYVIPS